MTLRDVMIYAVNAPVECTVVNSRIDLRTEIYTFKYIHIILSYTTQLVAIRCVGKANRNLRRLAHDGQLQRNNNNIRAYMARANVLKAYTYTYLCYQSFKCPIPNSSHARRKLPFQRPPSVGPSTVMIIITSPQDIMVSAISLSLSLCLFLLYSASSSINLFHISVSTNRFVVDIVVIIVITVFP